MGSQIGHNPKAPTTPDGQELINTNKHQGQIIGDGDTNRVVNGFQKDGFGDGENFGLKVSKPGNDVLTASDDQLIFSSAFNTFKIAMTDSLTVDYIAGSSVSSAEVVHGLGRIPAFMLYFFDGSNYHATPWYGGDTTIEARYEGISDIDTFAAQVIVPTASGFWNTNFSVQFRYYLLIETAN